MSFGRLNASFWIVAYDYDPAGRLIGLTDPNTGDVDYTLDDDGRLVLTELPNGETREFDFVNGQMVRHEDHSRTTELTYDESGRIATLTGAQNHSYTYDQAGQLLEAAQDEGTYAYTYGTRGELTSITDPERTRSFTNNAYVEIDTIIDGGGNQGSVLYDEAGRMTEHNDPDGTITTYAYDARGLLIETVITTPGVPNPDPCAGLTPTRTGTEGNDFLVGTRRPDVIFGLGGNDVILGLSGDDIICGGDGNDWIFGQGHNDTIYGGAGNDTISGSRGNDTIEAGDGADIVLGGFGADTVQGGDGNDAIFGGYGRDTLDGGNGIDIVNGSRGTDACRGELLVRCEIELQATGGGGVVDTEPVSTLEPSITGEVQVERRVVSGAGNLVGIEQDNGEAHQFLWDVASNVHQIVAWKSGATADLLVYGYRREIIGQETAEYSALGDAVEAGGAPEAPFATAANGPGVRFGYRGELESAGMVHLRARDISASLATFQTRDRLDGVTGTATLVNPHHYANNDPVNSADPLGLRPTDTSLSLPPASVRFDASAVLADEFTALASDVEALIAQAATAVVDVLDVTIPGLSQACDRWCQPAEVGIELAMRALLQFSPYERAPDYWVFEVGGTGWQINASLELIVTRDGTVFVAPEFGAGLVNGLGASVRGGWIKGSHVPGVGATDDADAGAAVNFEAGYGIVTMTATAPVRLDDPDGVAWSEFSLEIGFQNPGLSASVDGSFAFEARNDILNPPTWRF